MNSDPFASFKIKLFRIIKLEECRAEKATFKNKVQINNNYYFLASIFLLMTEDKYLLEKLQVSGFLDVADGAT